MLRSIYTFKVFIWCNTAVGRCTCMYIVQKTKGISDFSSPAISGSPLYNSYTIARQTQSSSSRNPGEVLAITKIHCWCNHSRSFSLDFDTTAFSSLLLEGLTLFFVYFMRVMVRCWSQASHKKYKKSVKPSSRISKHPNIQTETSIPSRMVASTMDLCNRQHSTPGEEPFSWILWRRTLCIDWSHPEIGWNIGHIL
jgi:hypothetical protein